MISLTTITADTAGALLVREHKPDTSINEPKARVSRSKTLDGGVHIEHSGVSDGDRTFTISVPEVTENQLTILKRLYRNYTSIHIACREGFFKGTIESLRVSQGRAVMKILIEQKIS